MLLESCMVYGSLTGPSIVETELLFVLIKSIDWAPSWMNRSSYCSHAVVFIQKQMAQLGYIFYFSDQNQWSSKHNNGLKPSAWKFIHIWIIGVRKQYFFNFCFIFSGWKIKEILTHLQLIWVHCDISLAFGKLDAPTLALALGVFWCKQLEHFARCSDTWMLEEACAHKFIFASGPASPACRLVSV